MVRENKVDAFDLRLSAEIGDAEAVAVGGYAAYHAFQNGVVLADFGVCSSRAWLGRPCVSINWPEAQRIHYGYRPRSHGEDVAKNAADARGCALKRLYERGMVMRLDLESAGPAIPDVDDAGILARSLDYAAAAGGQALQMDARRLVGAVFAPHHAEDAEFGEGRLASAQQLLEFFILIRREAVFPDKLRGNGKSWGAGHGKGEALFSHLATALGRESWGFDRQTVEDVPNYTVIP